MSNDPSEKQPPASPPEGSPTAQARPEPPEEEFPSDLDWQLRAHPVIEKTRAPAAAPAAPPAAAPPKPVPPAPATPPAPPPADKPAAAGQPSGGEAKAPPPAAP